MTLQNYPHNCAAEICVTVKIVSEAEISNLLVIDLDNHGKHRLEHATLA